MAMETMALQVFGMLTAKTVPVVLDFLGERLKMVLHTKKGKGKSEAESLRQEVERLRRQLQLKQTIGTDEIKQVEAQIEKVRLVQLRYGLELISDQAHKQWILEQFERLSETENSTSNFEINVWTQQGTSSTPRDISIIPKTAPGSYRIGDKITLFFRSNHDCYLTLFNLGTSGSVTVLFPNRLFQDNFIRANQTYSIPGKGYSFEYILSGPIGVERIKAIASMDKVNLADLDFSQGDRIFHSAERSAAAKDIQIVAKHMEELHTTGWATAMCEFDVR